MKSKTFTQLTVLLLTLLPLAGRSQLFIDTSYSAEQMVMDFFSNSCATPSNITFNGGQNSMAFFEGAGVSLGVNAGIFISTGNVFNAKGPNNSESAGSSTGNGSDTDLDLLTSATGFDAAVLEFDLTISDAGNLDFQYAFGSEEYCEFVNSTFNDVFGFFVSGPGITGPFSNESLNIATLSGSGIFVSINNINHLLNTEYFIGNSSTCGDSSSIDIQYDGLTVPLAAGFNAAASSIYHVKIGVQDAGDAIYDSGVFIGIESLCGDSLLTPPAEAIAVVDGNTATFENHSRYATSWHWDFGDGSTSDERHPGPHTYIQDGAYQALLVTQNWCCSDTFYFTVQIGELPSGTKEAARKPFKISPNPANDWLDLKVNGSEILTWTLADLTGRTVMTGETIGDTRLNVSHLQAGVYQLLVRNDQHFYSEKVMIR